MGWAKVVLIITAIIALVIALYLLLGILGINLAEIFIPTKPYQELTSMAALACAIDVVGTQNPDVSTCNKIYKWGKANVFETLTGYFITGMYYSPGGQPVGGADSGTGTKKDFDVACMHDPSAFCTDGVKCYICLSRRGDKNHVRCELINNQWKCKVIRFQLEQQFSDNIAIQVLQRVVNVVKGDVKDFIEKCLGGGKGQYCFPVGLGLVWTGFAGEPKYLVYYETFPKEMEGIWTVSVGEVAVSTIALGGALNLIGGSIGGLKVAGTAIKAGLKAGKDVIFLHYSFREAGSKFKQAVETRFWKEMSSTWVGKIALRKLAVAAAFPSTLTQKSVKEVVEEAISVSINKEIRDALVDLFAAARKAIWNAKAIPSDAAGDAWAQNIINRIYTWARITKGEKKLTPEVMKEIIEQSIPDSLPKDAKERLLAEFSKQLGKNNIDDAAKSLADVINGRDMIKRIYNLDILGDVNTPGTGAYMLKTKLAGNVLGNMAEDKTIIKMLVLSALKGKEKKVFLDELSRSGIIPAKYRKIYEDEVEEIALSGVHSIIEEYKYLQRVEGKTGLKKLANVIVGRIDLAWEAVKNEGLEGLFEGAAIRISSRLGLGPENWKKRLAILTLAGAYSAYAASLITEKFETCGGNSLCLHTQHFFKENNYNISLETQDKMIVTEYESDNILNVLAQIFLGSSATDPKKVRGFVISPCKADLWVERGKAKCEEFISSNTLAYTVPFEYRKIQDKVYIEFGYTYDPNAGAMDKCYISSSLNRNNFWQTLYENEGNECISLSTTYKIDNYKVYCSQYETLEDCIRGHFIEQFRDILTLPDNELENKLIIQYKDKITPCCQGVSKGEEIRNIILATPITPINMRLNVISGEEEVITSCKPPGNMFILGYEPWWVGQEREAVVIKADRDSMRWYKQNDPQKNTNFCIPHEGLQLEWWERGIYLAQVIPWEMVLAFVGSIFAPGAGTAAGYAAGMMINFVVGSAGAVFDKINEEKHAWPTDQFNP
jgi:hypothetical protein